MRSRLLNLSKHEGLLSKILFTKTGLRSLQTVTKLRSPIASSHWKNQEQIWNGRALFSTNVKMNAELPIDTNPTDLVKVQVVLNNVRTITLNRPAKKNALNAALFQALEKAIIDGNNDPSTNIIVLTGTGDYFSAGADVKEGLDSLSGPGARQNFKYLTKALIDCAKPIVVIVNGSAVGIGVTMLGLCDAVYASDSATFWTPFSQLGICAEACSSYTFPRIMGYAKACDMLMFGTKITASQAENCGLVTKVFPNAKLQEEAWSLIKTMSELPIKSLLYSKELVRGREREDLHKVNENEAQKLRELVQSRLNK